MQNRIGERAKRLALELEVYASENKLRVFFLIVFLLPGAIVFLILVTLTVQSSNTGFENKTLWDWMDLLLVPAALGIAIWWLNRSEKASEQKAVTGRLQENALQSYFDAVTKLLLEYDATTNTESQERRLTSNRKALLRTRTLSTLRAVGCARKSQILLFLYESGLATNNSQPRKRSLEVDLSYADFRGVEIGNASIDNIALNLVDLRDSVLQRTKMENASLVQADLRWADFSKTDLSLADLRNVNAANVTLIGTVLSDANLRGAYLFHADMRDAVLRGVDFRDATLSEADLRGANLEDADLRRANLLGAKVTEDQLTKVRKLDNAILPNGQKYEA